MQKDLCVLCVFVWLCGVRLHTYTWYMHSQRLDEIERHASAENRNERQLKWKRKLNAKKREKDEEKKNGESHFAAKLMFRKKLGIAFVCVRPPYFRFFSDESHYKFHIAQRSLKMLYSIISFS